MHNALAFSSVTRLPSATDVHARLPLPAACHDRIVQHRAEIKNILDGKDHRLLLVIGPCSAWPGDAVLQYAHRLKVLTAPHEHQIKVVLRVFTQKPRTVMGWPGPLIAPDPFAAPDVLAGIGQYRGLMLAITAQTGLAIADELLQPELSIPYFSDLLSYGVVGARSVQHPPHRQIASGLGFALGMKNPTSGDLKTVAQSVFVAQSPHEAVVCNGHVSATSGNPHAHVVLRGGADGPNYDTASICTVQQHLQRLGCAAPAIIIDTSHDNCRGANGVRDPLQQLHVAHSVMAACALHPHLPVRGLMVESFLHAGQHRPETLPACIPGRSITDGCLSWAETEQFVKGLVAHRP